MSSAEDRSPRTPDKRLFTPGPLTTSATVKQAMLRDLGSRDETFLAALRDVRAGLLGAYGLGAGWEVVPLQGSGTYAVEAAVSSFVPPGGRLLALVNGAYGERIVQMAAVHGIDCRVLRGVEDAPIDPAQVAAALAADPAITSVSLVHVETTSGVLNPLVEIGRVVHAAGRVFLVDAMSSFGALPIAFEDGHVDLLASSSNKCLEGVPGLAFVIARRARLEVLEGRARALVLDLFAQWKALEATAQFRFTPPTHVVLALQQALVELRAEGGVAGRGARYRRNHERLTAGMERLGFRALVPAVHRSPIITTYHYPTDPRWDFADVYARLSRRGFLVYPGKLTKAACFRLGNIGRLFVEDMDALLQAVAGVLAETGVDPRR